MLSQKINGILWRLLYYFRTLGKRFIRIIDHLKDGINHFIVIQHERKQALQSIPIFITWVVELQFLIFDLFGISELYETFADFLKYKTRPLKDWEIELAKEYFGDSLEYKLIRIDETARVVSKRMKVCYVSFHTINNWGPILNSTFIHELVHVWQYEKMGGKYIPKALKAQNSQMGYNYGGITLLEQHSKKGLNAFNLEQQADIIGDHYRISNNMTPRWGLGTIEHLNIYERYTNELQNT